MDLGISSSISAADNAASREARALAPDRQRSHDPSRARSSGRSQSRGRNPNPSELLARRQQLLAAGGDSASAWSTTPAADAIGNSGLGGGGQDQQQTGQTTSAADFSVEAKLESLSELLKSHQHQQNDAASFAAAHLQSQSPSSAKSIEDVYILLAKKEKDLQLAAELGKVLLEKNDELSKANERITEDYSQKLELLEQDKHRLKRKLDLLDSEYENRLIELQTDCNILKNQLDEQQQLVRQTEKEKSKLIDDLVQQNQRLTSELVEATKSEELLSSQLEQMNERFNNRLSNRQDHAVQLDTLKEEIQIVNQRKLDLERRLKLANSDKGNLNAALDESGDKILLLEKLLNEKDAKLSELLSEVNELRDSSSWLSNELESMLSLNERLVNAAGNDLEQQQQHQREQLQLLQRPSEGDPNELYYASQRKRSQLIEQLRELRLKTKSRLKAKEFMLINGGGGGGGGASSINGASSKQVGGDTVAWRRNGRGHSNGRKLASKRQVENCSSLYDEIESSNRSSQDEGAAIEDDDEEDDDEFDAEQIAGSNSKRRRRNGDDSSAAAANYETEEIVAEVYLLLQRFHQNLLLRKEELLLTQSSQTPVAAASQQHFYSAPNSADDSGISADGAAAIDGHKPAVADQVAWKRLLGSLKTLIEEMPCSTCRLMIAERAGYEQLQKLHAKLSEEVRKKDDQLLALSVAKMEQETKLANLEERCAILSNDLSNCDKPKEEIVRMAWKARDEAVGRKNAAEISLAKTRIENMQISSQLMEVVQQKGELSQKLAQFEDDIHYITQHSVKAKFTWEEYAEKLRRSKLRSQDTSANSTNPLAQLLSFSSVVVANKNATGGGGHTGSQSQQQQDNKSSAMDNLVAQPTSLMRNFTSNRFNLRFWQRNSSEKVTDKGTLISANNNNNTVGGNSNNNVAAVEQKAS